MGKQWKRWGVLVCALVGTLCLLPAHAATGKPAGHAVRAPAGAKKPQPHTAAAKASHAKPRTHAGAARKAGKPHAAVNGTRSTKRVAVRTARKSAPTPHGAQRPGAGKKPTRTGATRTAKPGAKPTAKAHGTLAGKRSAARKAPALRAGHKKTAH